MPKYRHQLFGNRHLRRMGEIMPSVCADFEAELVESKWRRPPRAPVVSFLPKVAVSKLVNSLKGVSSGRQRQEVPDLVRPHWHAQCRWSGS